MSRRSLRIITRVIVFLLLGAIVNVAVAWGCVLRAPQQNILPTSPSAQARVAAITKEVFAPPTGTNVILLEGPGVTHYRVDQWLMGDLPLIGAGATLIVKDGGWPGVALTGCCKQGKDLEWALKVPVGWQRPAGLFHGSADGFVPLRPIWPGFAVNTLFYAGILWMLFAAPLALRRRRRIKRGLCPACAYPVGASDVCTECGEPISRRIEIHR